MPLRAQYTPFHANWHALFEKPASAALARKCNLFARAGMFKPPNAC
jgi:hypothetical protein